MKATVVLPVYNGEKFLPAAIESILSQSFSDFELIIIDDGSTEDIASIVRSYRDERVVFLSRENRGLGETLNELISLARGEYVIRMDADDFSLPSRIAAQVEFLDEHPEVAMLGTGISFMIGDKVVPAFPPITEHEKIVSALFNTRFPLCHPSVAFRKRCFEEIGGYRVKGAGEDLDFFLRMSEVGKLTNLPEIHFLYRLSSTSLALRKQGELNRGYAYAIYCARLRRQRVPEISMEEFDVVWRQRSLVNKLYCLAYNHSERLYRGAIVSRAEGRRLIAVLQIILASVLRPRTTLGRVSEIMRSFLRRSWA